MISQETLFTYLSYDPDSGVFTWIKRPSNRVKVGSEAGSIMSIGYRAIKIDGQVCYAHRLAWLYMTGDMPDCEIDHINMDKLDNRWQNLRLATKKQNTENRRHLKTNTSGHMGVYWVGRYNKWFAKIVHNGKQIHLGYFVDKQGAINARVAAEKQLFSHAPSRSVL